jgi:glutamate-1-semialdehyde 2,1-aminomutase
MAQDRMDLAAQRLAVVTPGGAQTRSKRRSAYPSNFPTILDWADGATVTGHHRTYVDWIGGLGAVSIGYRDPAIDIAVQGMLNRGGPSWSLPHRTELTTSEALMQALGWPEQVRWLKTGSEATAAAMMIARRAAGKRKILSVGYHGWHDVHQPGPDLVQVEWSDPFLANLPQDMGEFAAVIIECDRTHVQTFADYEPLLTWGPLVILDECVSGFRWRLGGIGEYLKIPADLAVFGKGMANGYPLACVVGRRDLMEFASDVSGTFGGETVSLAAAQAVLTIYGERNVTGYMWDLGQRFIDAGVATGWPCRPTLAGDPWKQAERAADAGHLIHPSAINISYSHTREQVDDAIAVLKKGLA